MLEKVISKTTTDSDSFALIGVPLYMPKNLPKTVEKKFLIEFNLVYTY